MFTCQETECMFATVHYRQLVNHLQRKHASPQFRVKCLVAGCTNSYVSIRSWERHIRSKHTEFYREHATHYPRFQVQVHQGANLITGSDPEIENVNLMFFLPDGSDICLQRGIPTGAHKLFSVYSRALYGPAPQKNLRN